MKSALIKQISYTIQIKFKPILKEFQAMFDFKHPSNSNHHLTTYTSFDIETRQRRTALKRCKFKQATYAPPSYFAGEKDRQITGAEIDTALDEITQYWDI